MGSWWLLPLLTISNLIIQPSGALLKSTYKGMLSLSYGDVLVPIFSIFAFKVLYVNSVNESTFCAVGAW